MVVFLCFESYILQSNLISRQKQVQMHNEAARYINDKNLNGSQQNLTEVTLAH